MIKPDEQRRAHAAKRLEANYTSLPSIVCDDFFNSYSRCLFGSQAAHNAGRINSRSQIKSRTRTTKQVRVYCQISELDESSGGQQRLVRRRHLTQVKEEEPDDDDDDDDLTGEHADYESLEDENNNQREQCVGLTRISLNTKDPRFQQFAGSLDKENFGTFLRNQAASKLTGRSSSQVNLTANSGGSTASGSSPVGRQQLAVSRTAANSNSSELRCYELFCVHQSSLLVHRTQVMVEAERLAQRLAQLVSSVDSATNLNQATHKTGPSHRAT